MTQQKFRPYLSPSQLTYILSLLEKDAKDPELIQSFKLLSFKISSGISTPNYTTKPTKPSKFSPLGLGLESPEELRKIEYDKYLQGLPHNESMVTTYRYENNLMTPQEETEYEQATISKV